MSIARRRAGATEDSQPPARGFTDHRPLQTSTSSQGAEPTRLAPARARRRIARRVRRLAGASPERDPVRRRYVFVLVDRVADVRDDLLEVADLIEQAATADPRCLAEVRRLLTSGCDSALYNPDIHVSELHASLYFLRCRLQDAAESPDDAPS
jgi:hypothetical protein